MASKNFNKIDFEYDNDYKQEMAPMMIRQRHKTQLILTTNFQLEALSKDKVLYGRKFKKARRDLLKDYFLGVKKINKKNPVFIEMPKLQEVANGQVKKVYDDTLENKPETEEILISHSDILAIEDTKSD